MSAEDQIDAQVAQLLTESLAAHRNAIQARLMRRRSEARTWTQAAYDARLAAQTLDPTFAAPAWQDEDTTTAPGLNTHLSLLSFYATQLSR